MNHLSTKHSHGTAAMLLLAALMPACRTVSPPDPAPPRAAIDALLAPETVEKLRQLPIVLGDREYVVPDLALAAYVKVLAPPKFMAEETTNGARIGRDRLAPPKLLAAFRETLRSAGFDDARTATAERLFRTADVIVVAERAVHSGHILVALPHERFHRAMKQLPADVYKHMMEVADALKWAQKPGTEDYLLEERDPNDLGFIMMAARTGSREEIFAYMADGKFTDAAEAELKRLSPCAHEVFAQLRAMTR